MLLFASYVLHTDAVVRNYCRALLSPPTLAFHIFKDFLRLAARRQPRPRDLRGPEAGTLNPPGRLRLSAGFKAGSTQGSSRIGPEVPINIFSQKTNFVYLIKNTFAYRVPVMVSTSVSSLDFCSGLVAFLEEDVAGGGWDWLKALPQKFPTIFIANSTDRLEKSLALNRWNNFC